MENPSRSHESLNPRKLLGENQEEHEEILMDAWHEFGEYIDSVREKRKLYFGPKYTEEKSKWLPIFSRILFELTENEYFRALSHPQNKDLDSSLAEEYFKEMMALSLRRNKERVQALLAPGKRIDQMSPEDLATYEEALLNSHREYISFLSHTRGCYENEAGCLIGPERQITKKEALNVWKEVLRGRLDPSFSNISDYRARKLLKKAEEILKERAIPVTTINYESILDEIIEELPSDWYKDSQTSEESRLGILCSLLAEKTREPCFVRFSNPRTQREAEQRNFLALIPFYNYIIEDRKKKEAAHLSNMDKNSEEVRREWRWRDEIGEGRGNLSEEDALRFMKELEDESDPT